METEYIKIKDFPELIGKRARFKDKLKGYVADLWLKEGTIIQEFQVQPGDLDHIGLSIRFDEKPNKASELSSCYIMPNSYELLN